MGEKKRIKIFTAYDKDVEEDVVRFGDFLCGLNAQCPNIEFSVFKSEKDLCESLERPREQIDSELDSCECFLLVLGGTRDEFAVDKLNRAIEHYAKTHGNPDIHIFVNAANKNAGEVINYFASAQYGHYVEQFEHNDTLKTKFLVWLSAKQKELTYEVGIDEYGTPVIKLGGVPVSGLVDFDALLNNADYQDEKKILIRKREDHEKYRQKMLKAGDVERDGLWNRINNLNKEIGELQEKIAAMERDTLEVYQNYAEKTLESGYNKKLKEAVEYIESGDLEMAKISLDPDGSINNLKAIVNEHELLAAQMEANKSRAKQEINILFTHIDILKLDTRNKNRFVEIERCYANIEYFQEKLGLEMTVLFGYALFLAGQKKHDAAIEKYKKELARLRKLVETNPEIYLSHQAGVLMNLANMQRDTGRYQEAESTYTEALEICRKQAETNPEAYLTHLTGTLINLGALRANIGRYKEAESAYTEALENCRKQAETNPEAYLTLMTGALYSLANLQVDTGRHKEAESAYTEAVENCRKLAETNPDDYLKSLAWMLNNLANLQKDTGKYEEAEKNYAEALEIRKKLEENNQEDK
jgi:tetratricopeptide (TPR) repeat protein